MSDPRQPAIRLAGSLDPASRYRAAWFLVRLLGLAVLAYGPYVTGASSLQDAAKLLSFACSVGGVVSMVFARLRGELVGRGALNGWDEALAFVAMARLTHFAAFVQA